MKYFLLALFSFFLLGEVTHAQTTSNGVTLNSASMYGKVGNQLYDFSVGEMVLVQTFQTNSLILNQGFLQPVLLETTAPDIVIVNNILTPNADGKNDFFVVKGLENYPSNKIKIFDRAGRTVFAATNYKNDWDGYVDGKPLAEDTYYYILDLGKASVSKGFISILFKN
ncbi:gliding motility-associated C-terminal domain-containing protein [Pedobacter sp. MW01-1-1]